MSTTVFHFPDGSVGPGRWDPAKGEIVPDRFIDHAIQIEWHDDPILVAYISPGLYWISTPWFGNRNERLVSREALEDHWPEEVLELVDGWSV